MKKKILLLVLSVICLTALLCGILAVQATAPETATIRLESATARAGTTVSVNVSISNNPGIATMGLDVSFDEGLTLISAKKGEALADLMFTPPSQLKNGGRTTEPCRFAWAGSDNAEEDGVLLTLTFEVDDSITSERTCNISVVCDGAYNENRSLVNIEPATGAIDIITYIPGDVDGNGIINMLDVLMLCQYYVDGCKYDLDGYAVTINENAGDVDANGVLNMLDVLLICQYYVDGCKYDPDGYAVELLPGNMNAHSSQGLEFTSNGDGTCYVSGIGTCTDTDIAIPPVSPNGDSVTSIGSQAFRGSFLKSVTIPDSVTSIGERAFYYCTSLTSVTIPDSVTSIGYYAFAGCRSLTSITVAEGNPVYHSAGNCIIETASKTLIAGCKNSVIPTDGSVTSIGYGAFSNCTSLTSVTIPDSVTSIGDWVFSDCTSLTSVTIPDSVTSIGRYAFHYCTSLTSVTIPDSVTSIGYYAFANCTKLQYNVYDNAKYLGNVNNPYVALIKASDTSITSCNIHSNTKVIYCSAFSNCTSLTSITIPNGVTSIGSFAFNGCTSLTSVTIPDSVTSIEGFAFFNCTSLTSVTIPDSVTSIGSFAFCDCTSLTSVTIPDSVTSIGDGAFHYCTSLTSVTIPDSVTSIGDWAFYECTSLTSIDYQGTKAQWNAISKGSDWNYNTGSYTIHCTDGDIAKS